MARINLETIKKIEKERNTVHSKVDATYTVFKDGDEKFIQVDTYGSSNREIKGKISQSIQFDRETAKYLLEIFIEEYGLRIDFK